jgi:DNA-binding protein HU-beta
MARINKAELIAEVAGKAGTEKPQAQRDVEAFLLAIGEHLDAGDEIRITDFGTFAVHDTPARKGKNPRTGAEIDIAAARKVFFRPSKALKERLNPRPLRFTPAVDPLPQPARRHA